MGEEIRIRKAVKDDAELLAEFNQSMALETEGKRLADDVISAGVRAVFEDDEKGFYLVAEDADSRIAGGLMVTKEWSDWRNGWFWWIQSVYVIPDFRGQGIYSKLYGKVKELAGMEGNVCGFRLYVEKDNKIAQNVYEKEGMTETEYLLYEEEV